MTFRYAKKKTHLQRFLLFNIFIPILKHRIETKVKINSWQWYWLIMSNENDDDRYAVYILDVPLRFGSSKLNNILKTNGINASLVFSPPKKGERFANVKAILDNAEGS